MTKYGIEYTGYIEIDVNDDNNDSIEIGDIQKAFRKVSNEQLGKNIHTVLVNIEDNWQDLY